MKEKFTFIVLSLFLLTGAYAQSGSSVSGTIQDEQGKNIASATISLLQ